MTSATLRVLSLAVSVLGLSLHCAGANADEVFICEGNKMLRVELDKLEHMKRTNACVAAHYGLVVQKPAPKAKRATKTSSGAAKPAMPVPLKADATKPKKRASKPLRASRQKSSQPAAVAKLGRADGKASKPPRINKNSGQAGLSVKRQGALPKEPAHVQDISAEPSDYRNVRVLNARSKPEQWYRHVY